MERSKFIAGLREMADFYESTPEAELPIGDLTINYFVHGDDVKDRMAKWARLLSPVQKLTLGEGPTGWYCIRRTFGAIVIDVNAYRKNVCTPRVVRTEHVPEKVVPEQVIPARDVDVIEWDCPTLLSGEEVAL